MATNARDMMAMLNNTTTAGMLARIASLDHVLTRLVSAAQKQALRKRPRNRAAGAA